MPSELTKARQLLAHRMERLLRRVRHYEGARAMRDQMRECERLLEEASMYPMTTDLELDDPAQWSIDHFLANPYTIPLVEEAMRNPRSVDSAESPEDLVLRLLPSDGHME